MAENPAFLLFYQNNRLNYSAAVVDSVAVSVASASVEAVSVASVLASSVVASSVVPSTVASVEAASVLSSTVDSTSELSATELSTTDSVAATVDSAGAAASAEKKLQKRSAGCVRHAAYKADR